jgi:WD40 repeat protein
VSLAKLETWREDSSAAFSKGRRERVVISDGGRIRLSHALGPIGTLDANRVWDLAHTPDGDVFAATGDAGKVFRRPAQKKNNDNDKAKDKEKDKDDAAWSVVYDARDTQALALAVRADGHVFAGTGPSGQVVDLTDPDHPASQPDRSVQYVWDLAADPAGNLYAATGPSGQLWKRSAEGKWSQLLDSRHSHLLSVAVGPDGSVYAGSDGEGLIYRVAPDGKATVVHDAPQAEIRVLRFGPDGALYAGTASDSGGGPGRGPVLLSVVGRVV